MSQTFEVTGVGRGTCDVKFTAGGKSATCRVTVASKNLLRYGPYSGDVGISATVNADGSLHVSGTASRQYASITWVQDVAALRGKTVAFSASGLPTGMQAMFDVYAADGTPTFVGPGKSVTVPADASNVRLRVYDSRETPAAVGFDLKPQLELGTTQTAWERPDNVSWGGVAPRPNFWMATPSVTSSGVTYATGEHGQVTVSGAATVQYSNTNSARQSMPAGTYCLSCAGGTSGTYAQFSVRHADGTVSYVNTINGASKVTVVDGDAVACTVQRAQTGGDSGAATLWPMLAEGTEPQPYEPYVRGVTTSDEDGDADGPYLPPSE